MGRHDNVDQTDTVTGSHCTPLHDLKHNRLAVLSGNWRPDLRPQGHRGIRSPQALNTPPLLVEDGVQQVAPQCIDEDMLLKPKAEKHGVRPSAHVGMRNPDPCSACRKGSQQNIG